MTQTTSISSIYKTSTFGFKISSTSVTVEDKGAHTGFGKIRKTLAYRNIEVEVIPTLHISTDYYEHSSAEAVTSVFLFTL